VPAPAVIPAPKAYINAVAVKGFVVELRAVSRLLIRPVPPARSGRRPLTLRLVNTISKRKQRTRDWCQFPDPGLVSNPSLCKHCDQPASKTGGRGGESLWGKHACHARRGAPVIFYCD
jgi:hypothetical protein